MVLTILGLSSVRIALVSIPLDSGHGADPVLSDDVIAQRYVSIPLDSGHGADRDHQEA